MPTKSRRNNPFHCPACEGLLKGDGKCTECYGTGKNVHLDSTDTNCPRCAGTGTCPLCQGSGLFLAGRAVDYIPPLKTILRVVAFSAGLFCYALFFSRRTYGAFGGLPFLALGTLLILRSLFWR